MNELLAQLFGSQPSYAGQLLGEDEARRLQQQAQQSGLLNVGLALLAGAGPSPQRRGVGELLAQGVMAGQQAYQGAYSKAVQERALMEQLAERRQAQADVQAAQRALQGAFAPREMYGEDIMGQKVGVGMTAPQLDMTRLQGMLAGLTPGARSQVLKEASSIQTAFAPRRMTLKEGEQIFEETPEGLRSIAGVPKTEKPEKPPTSIQEYNFAVENGYKGSFEDFKRLGAATTNINMPTGEERKAAVLANRLNFGVQQMNEAIGREPTAAMPNTAAEAARFFTRSDFIANTITPAQRQVVETAQLDVLDAALTLGTGAAYTREQLEGYRKSYFPQMGDDAATVKSKQQRLENLLKSAQIASGRAGADIPTPMPKPITPQAQEAAPTLPSGVRVRKKDGT